jgi:DNA helicase-2/ATP-dependent DNA helicase PcrA
LSEAERVVFFRERLFRLPLRHFLPLHHPVRHLQALLKAVGRAKDEAVGPEEVIDHARRSLAKLEGEKASAAEIAEARRRLEFALVYRAMDEELHRAGRIDFGDQILFALRILERCPHVLAALRRRFRHILVDEFQDTNVAQFELIKLLAGGHRNITVVGDDDQSIYKFRGAAIGNILGFSSSYPDRSLVVLTRSYRSGQVILDAAYRLIQHNNPERLEVQEKIEKRLQAAPEAPGAIEHHRYDTLPHEAEAVVARIRALAASGCALKDLAILVRSNRDAEAFLMALAAAGIPHEFSGHRNLFVRPEVMTCISFLRSVTRPSDSQSLFALAASDVYAMPMADLSRLSELARRRHQSLRRLIAEAAGDGSLTDTGGAAAHSAADVPEPVLGPEGRAAARRLEQDLTAFTEAARRRTTGELLYEFLTESGTLAALTAAATAEAEEKIRNLARFFELTNRVSRIGLADRAHAFVDHLDLLIEAGDEPLAAEPDPDFEAVRVLTVHRAKGLEFPVVFVANLVDRKFPTQGRRDAIELPPELYREPVAGGDFHLSEERRLFYVAMTRARRLLVLTSAADHGGVATRKLSRFVIESLDLAPAQAGAAIAGTALGTIARHATSPAAPPASQFRLPGPDDVLRLSYTRIESYLTCPLRYKFAYVFHAPAIAHHRQSYGKAMHDAIAHLLRGRMGGASPAVDDLREAFRNAWRSEGFLSREHEERRFEAGIRTLERFYAQETAGGTRPAQVEKEFAFTRGKSRVEGRFDRVDLGPDGATVIDYKTANVTERSEAERQARHSLQLRLYALAYRHQSGALPRRGELRFVETGLAGAAELGEKEAGEAEEAIDRAAEGIRAGRFEAQPSLPICAACAFVRICPHAAT